MAEDFFHDRDNSEEVITQTSQKHPTGLSIAAFVLGVVAILGSWIPYLNIISIVLGILAVIFGTMTLVKARRENIGKDFPIIAIVLGSLTIIFSLIITITVSRLIENENYQVQPRISYDLKTDESQDEQIDEMTPAELLSYYHTLADDYVNLAKDFQENPDSDTLYEQVLELNDRCDEVQAQLSEIKDDLSDKQQQQALKDADRILEASEILNGTEFMNDIGNNTIA